jgi:hypothetical protein
MHAIRVISHRVWLRACYERMNIGIPGAIRIAGRSFNRTRMELENAAVQKKEPSSCEVYCDTARRLLEDFGEAVSVVLQFHQDQFHAIMEGDGDAGRFDVLIHEANEVRQNAKYAYLSHLHQHGCSANKWNL